MCELFSWEKRDSLCFTIQLDELLNTTLKQPRQIERETTFRANVTIPNLHLIVTCWSLHWQFASLKLLLIG
jgi:hypothetical protein